MPNQVKLLSATDFLGGIQNKFYFIFREERDFRYLIFVYSTFLLAEKKYQTIIF